MICLETRYAYVPAVRQLKSFVPRLIKSTKGVDDDGEGAAGGSSKSRAVWRTSVN
jgi:hypothetical protein